MVGSRRFTTSGNCPARWLRPAVKFFHYYRSLLSKLTGRKKITFGWSSFTDLEKDKQGAAVLLTLEGAAEEAALELDVSVINSYDGLNRLSNSISCTLKIRLKISSLRGL